MRASSICFNRKSRENKYGHSESATIVSSVCTKVCLIYVKDNSHLPELSIDKRFVMPSWLVMCLYFLERKLEYIQYKYSTV